MSPTLRSPMGRDSDTFFMGTPLGRIPSGEVSEQSVNSQSDLPAENRFCKDFLAREKLQYIQRSFRSSAGSSRTSSRRKLAENNMTQITTETKDHLRLLLAPRTMDAEKVERKKRQRSSTRAFAAKMIRHGSQRSMGSDRSENSSRERIEEVSGIMVEKASKWSELDCEITNANSNPESFLSRGGVNGSGRRTNALSKKIDRHKTISNAKHAENITLIPGENGYMYDSPMPLEDCERKHCGDMRGHIVIMGCQQGVDKLVATLRSRTSRHIDDVVFFVQTMSTSLWRKLGRYPHVYVVIGWVKHDEDLIRLNLTKAKAVIVLRDDFGDGDNFQTILSAQGMTKEGEDAKVLFKTLLLKYHFPNTNVSCEFAHESSVRFMQARHEFHLPIGDCEFTPAFAEGQIMIASSTCDIIAAKSFFHPHISDAIFELIAPMSAREETLTYVDNIKPSSLHLIDMPREYVDKTFSQVFTLMCTEHKCILVGVQHAAKYLDNDLPYSVINPQLTEREEWDTASHDTGSDGKDSTKQPLKLRQEDKLFVVAHHAPMIDTKDPRPTAMFRIEEQLRWANEKALTRRQNPAASPSGRTVRSPSGYEEKKLMGIGMCEDSKPTYTPLLKSGSKVDDPPCFPHHDWHSSLLDGHSLLLALSGLLSSALPACRACDDDSFIDKRHCAST